MSTSRRTHALVVAVSAVVAVAAVTVTIAVTTASSRDERPEPTRARLTGYSLVKSGGIAGVRHQVDVSADGTVLYADDQPVAGRLPPANMDRLGEVLADRRLAKENGRAGPGSACADAFTYTLTVGATRVAKDDCGGDATPLLDEVITLTAKDELRPLPSGTPRFRGLTATYEQMWEKERAKVRIDAEGSTEVTRNGGPVRRDQLDRGTLDALRVLYARPVATPMGDSDVECAPEQIPRYEITPEGGRQVRVSVCGRLDDHRWIARLTIIRNLVRD